MNVSLGISNFLKRSLVFPILLFSSISLHCSSKKALLSLLVILWNSAFRCLYLSFSPLTFTSLLFIDVCKPSSDNHFAFLHFFFLGIVLITCSVVSDYYNYMDCRPSVSVHGISLAKILEFVAISSSRGSSDPGMKPMFLSSSALAGGFLITAPPGKL